jgi:hypothetical protein
VSLGNYPPGVTGNESAITGIYPIEDVLDGILTDLDRMSKDVEYALGDISSVLDDQGVYTQEIERSVIDVELKITDLKDQIRGLYPPDEYDYADMVEDDYKL